MRTTFNLDDQLYRDLKRLSVETGRTLKDLLEESLRERLARRRKGTARRRVTLPTFRGGGLLPGVDLDDTASLLDRMEGHGSR
jgi:hypothetical protein